MLHGVDTARFAHSLWHSLLSQRYIQTSGHMLTARLDTYSYSHIFIFNTFLQALAPEYAKASVTLSELAPEVVLAQVDATEENALAEKYGVQGFPTMIWFHDGKESEYDGGRDECAPEVYYCIVLLCACCSLAIANH